MGRAYRVRGTVFVPLTLVLGLLATGCANTSKLAGHHTSTHAAGQDGPAAAPAQVAVVRRWSAALQRGDIRAASAYFHLPSLFENGVSDTVEIRTAAQAQYVNSTLSCGAQVISAFRTGDLIDVLFRLRVRAGPGGGKRGCGTGVGLTARTKFLIRDGQIFEWLRAPSLPGDPGAPGGATTSTTPTTPAPTTPGGTTTSGNQVRDVLPPTVRARVL